MTGIDASAIIATLAERGATVATAESLTGGLVCAELTSVPGSSAVVRGAVVSYVVEVKAEVLGVDPTVLERQGAVDPAVAVQMAAGVSRLLGADFGISTTGSAGPDPDPGGTQTGPVAPGRGYVAVVGPGVEIVTGFACEGEDRAGVRRHAVTAVLAILARALAETNGDGRTSAGAGSVDP